MKTRMMVTTMMIGAQMMWATVASAAIPRSLIRYQHLSLNLSLVHDFSKGFNIASVQPIESLRSMKSEDVGKYIPSNMAPTSNGGLVAAQVLDRSLNTIFNSDTVRNSDFGRTAHKVEKSMEGDVAFGGTQPNSVKHSLKFAMRATQSKALVEYSGLTNAELSYQIASSTLNFELREPVAMLNTSVVYNHVAQTGENRDILSLRWKW